MNFQRDGYHQIGVPPGRVNYSPSSLASTGARPDPKIGYVSYPEKDEGDKMRVRPESFSDHYSQARQFFFSLPEPEQNHLIAAFTFELSKVETKAVRARLLSQLANVDMALPSVSQTA